MDTPTDAQIWAGLWTAAGTGFAAFVAGVWAYIRRKPQPVPQPQKTEVRGAAIMDSELGESLLLALQAQTSEMVSSRESAKKIAEDAAAAGSKMLHAVEKLAQEVEEHRKEIRFHGDKMAASRHR